MGFIYGYGGLRWQIKDIAKHYIELPDYMMDENNKEWENIRNWRKETLEDINSGKESGFCYPKHPDIKVYLD